MNEKMTEQDWDELAKENEADHKREMQKIKYGMQNTKTYKHQQTQKRSKEV